MIVGIVLAAGYGRLTTTNGPKVLAPVAGVPMCYRQIRHLLGVAAAVVIVANEYTFEPLRAFAETFPGNRVIVVLQPWRSGTAGATAFGLAGASYHDPSHVIIASGDMPLLCEQTFERLAQDMNVSRHVAAFVTTVEAENGVAEATERYGRVIKLAGRIERIVEFTHADRQQREIQTRNVGLYGFRVDFLRAHLARLYEMNGHSSGPVEYHLPALLREVPMDDPIVEIPLTSALEALGVNSDEDYDRVCKAYTELYR